MAPRVDRGDSDTVCSCIKNEVPGVLIGDADRVCLLGAPDASGAEKELVRSITGCVDMSRALLLRTRLFGLSSSSLAQTDAPGACRLFKVSFSAALVSKASTHATFCTVVGAVSGEP